MRGGGGGGAKETGLLPHGEEGREVSRRTKANFRCNELDFEMRVNFNRKTVKVV